MKLIDEPLLNSVSAQAKASPRMRMNYNFHQSLDDKCHRMLNALEPGTEIPIHRHPEKDESFEVLRGKVRSTTYKENCSAIESVVLCPEVGLYGVDIPQGVRHKHPRDNAIAERVNGILKTEWLHDDHFQGLEEAYKRLAQVINPSNHNQPPLSLNHQTPAPANPETDAQARVWKNSYKAHKPEEAEPVKAEMTG